MSSSISYLQAFISCPLPWNKILNPYCDVQGPTWIWTQHITNIILIFSSSPPCSPYSSHTRLLLVSRSNMFFPSSVPSHVLILHPAIFIPITFTWINLIVLSGLRWSANLFGKSLISFQFVLEIVHSHIIPNLSFVALTILLIICLVSTFPAKL